MKDRKGNKIRSTKVKHPQKAGSEAEVSEMRNLASVVCWEKSICISNTSSVSAKPGFYN